MQLFRSKRKPESFGFSRLEENTLKSFEFAGGARCRTIALMNIDLRNSITRDRTRVRYADAYLVSITHAHAVLAEMEAGKFECRVAETVPERIKRFGRDIPIAGREARAIFGVMCQIVVIVEWLDSRRARPTYWQLPTRVYISE